MPDLIQRVSSITSAPGIVLSEPIDRELARIVLLDSESDGGGGGVGEAEEQFLAQLEELAEHLRDLDKKKSCS